MKQTQQAYLQKQMKEHNMAKGFCVGQDKQPITSTQRSFLQQLHLSAGCTLPATTPAT
jgi:hypothetical protein